MNREELKQKLKQKLTRKKLERQSQFSRDLEIEELTKKLKNRKLPSHTRRLYKSRLKLLEEIDDEIFEKGTNTMGSDIPDYD